jgi:hypothetical protein
MKAVVHYLGRNLLTVRIVVGQSAPSPSNVTPVETAYLPPVADNS